MNLKGLKINFLGDSITEGHGCSSEALRFADRIAEEYGAVTRCYGIGGTRLARQTKPSENPRHDLDFPSRVAEMAPDADVVVVFGGTNDFGHGDAPFGTPADRTADTFYGALHELYTSLLTKYPAAQFVVITSLHRSTENEPNMHGKVLKDYVDAIRQAAEYYSLARPRPVRQLRRAACRPRDEGSLHARRPASQRRGPRHPDEQDRQIHRIPVSK